MARNGYDTQVFARRLGVKPQTVGLHLGSESFKTKRYLSDEFIKRVQKVTNLKRVESVPTASP